MANRFASGKNAISECDRCGFRFKLKALRKEIIKTKNYNILVCTQCWDPDQPQLQLGMYPVDDPQGIRDPRPDISYYQSGLLVDGNTGEGSRVFQWNWNPVGGASGFATAETPNYLVMAAQVGTVQVTVS
jgi:hypothetical protein